MLHLIDRLVVFLLIELVEPPVLEHTRMKKVLIDGRELIGQHLIQMLDDFFIAFHDISSKKWLTPGTDTD
jgi:hypothetical protein